jgi:sensor histidine kinase YesM
MYKRDLMNWGLVFLCWTFIAVFYTSEAGFQVTYEKRPFDWLRVLRGELVYSYVWLIITPLIIRLDRRMREGRWGWLRRLPVYLSAGVCFSALHSITVALVLHPLGWGSTHPSLAARVQTYFVNFFHLNLLFYAGTLGVYHAFNYYRESRERELKASRLEAQLAQAQLQNLKMQLHPHFLFNTLHTISVLMSKDVEAANRMLIQLSDLLRVALDNAGAQEVSLREEMEFLEQYLEIERTRFEDRLSVRTEVDPAAYDAQVPNLILQPLVENAIRHGIAPRTEPGAIEIRASREEGKVRLQVQDDGPGIDLRRQPALREGIGLTNTRARLAQMYGADHQFEMRNGSEGGLLVTIILPFRLANETSGE